MDLSKEKLFFDAMRTVLHDETFWHISEPFHEFEDLLIKLQPELTQEQWDIVEYYIRYSTDVFVEAARLALEMQERNCPNNSLT